MIKERLQDMVEKAVQAACRDGRLGELSEFCEPVVIEQPKLAEHGDFACGVALKLARQARVSPVAIAETLGGYIAKTDEVNNDAIARLEVARPGFINFTLGRVWLADVLQDIHIRKEEYGRANIGNGLRVLVEYVSANPTGGLHIGHGRGAVLGSCLANLLEFAGYIVEQEFYVNDTGAQINQLGWCAWACYQRKLGRNVEYPGEGYPEESIAEFVEKVIELEGERFLQLQDDKAAFALASAAKQIIRAHQEVLLENLGIKFDRWFSEESLHGTNKVNEAMERLVANQYTYENDGALWLKASQLGDERDRVLKKSSGDYTYLASDAAYHLDKYKRGYDLLINIWGADHHGQVPGLKAVVQALGYDPAKLEVVLAQIVNLCRDGKTVRMSKRRGTVVMLDEVIEEVGRDAVRYYLAESNPQNPINFDLELARKQSRDNPAFYIQYAHARCSSILRRALEPVENQETGTVEGPAVSAEIFAEFKRDCQSNPKLFFEAFEADPEKFRFQKSLVLKLEALSDEVQDAVQSRQPGKLARYAYELANDLQKAYEVSRVITDDLSVTKARLGMITATRQVLANTLRIVGIHAPERM